MVYPAPNEFGTACKQFYTEEGNWDLLGNNTPVFFLRNPLKFPDGKRVADALGIPLSEVP